MRKINKIILHCSATKENQYFDVDDIRQWHLQRGFNDVGYHYIILLDGTVQKGRDESVIGAHCKGQNSNSIGICYIGGVDENNKAKDTRTDAQKESLVKLVKELMDKYKLDSNDIYGHYQFANKACPSFDVNDFKNNELK